MKKLLQMIIYGMNYLLKTGGLIVMVMLQVHLIKKILVCIDIYIYGLINNIVPDIVDHINNDRKDNRISNLRENTSSGNNHNKSKTKNASSKFFGVYYSKQRIKWLASITLNNKQYHIGLFKNEIEAAKAYNIKTNELYGDKANLNEIPKLKIKHL